jgi:hypothetical protein
MTVNAQRLAQDSLFWRNHHQDARDTRTTGGKSWNGC